MRIGFDPHLDNINTAFERHFSKCAGIDFELIRRPRWRDVKILLPFTMAFFIMRFFIAAIRRYDLVHVNSAKVALIAFFASFFGAKYIFTIHGCPHPELEREEGFAKSLLSGLEIRCMKLAVKRACAVTTISKFSQQELLERYGVKSIVVYNGIDPMRSDLSRGEARSSLNLFGCDPVYISVGRMIAYKDPLRVLSIFYNAEKGNPRARLIYIGDGNLRKAFLAEVKALNIEEKVIHLCYVSYHEMAHSYAAANYFISGCDYEGFGLAAVESLICGCRPLLPSKGAFPEIFQDSSFFYDDNHGFRKGSLDEKQRERVLADFSWDRALAQWEELYKKGSE